MPRRPTFLPAFRVLAIVSAVDCALTGAALFMVLRLEAAGLTPAAIGLIGGAYYGGFLGGSLIARVLTARLRRPSGTGALLLLALALGGLGAVPPGWSWALLRLMAGLGAAVTLVLLESGIGNMHRGSRLGAAFASYQMAASAGSALGPIVLLALGSGLVFPVVASAGLLVLAWAARLGLPPTCEVSAVPGLARSSSPSSGPMPMMAVLACATAGFANASLLVQGPVHLVSLGAGEGQAAFFVTLCLVANVALKLPLGWAGDLWGRPTMVPLVAGLGALATIVLVLGATDARAVLLAGAATAGLTGQLYGLGASLALEQTAPHRETAASGATLFAWGLGSILGPVISGLVAGLAGSGSTFLPTLLPSAAVCALGILKTCR